MKNPTTLRLEDFPDQDENLLQTINENFQAVKAAQSDVRFLSVEFSAQTDTDASFDDDVRVQIPDGEKPLALIIGQARSDTAVPEVFYDTPFPTWVFDGASTIVIRNISGLTASTKYLFRALVAVEGEP